MANAHEIQVPDIGGATDVEVIEINVQVGDQVEPEQPLITLETDKATMDVPSPQAGVVTAISINLGDKVSEGSVIMQLEAAAAAASAPAAPEPVAAKAEAPAPVPPPAPPKVTAPAPPPVPVAKQPSNDSGEVHAGPAVRRFARELGVELSQVTGSGPKGRILKEDVQNYVSQRLAAPSGGGLSVAAGPEIDFSRFGEIETQPLSKIKRLSGENLHRNWVTIPHVTQQDDADITELEALRKSLRKQAEHKGVKLTLLPFIMKAVVAALKAYPHFNASLDASGQNLILKHYYHLGIAIDTPNGLVVAVIRDVDQKGVWDLAAELATTSQQAREKGLTPVQMQGSCFSISNLGAFGGTGFTPIVNAPDVAILGLSRASTQPVWQAEQASFQPRLILPLSLSYDHRVIDGVAAAKFTRHLENLLADLRQALL